MTQEIKPCPFCGSTDIDPEGVACFKPEYKGGSVGWDKATDDMIVHRPACNSCGATTDGDWNTRAEPAPLPDDAVCVSCGHIGKRPPPPALSCCPERKTISIRAHIAAQAQDLKLNLVARDTAFKRVAELEAENKRLRDLLECWDGVANSHEPTGHKKDCGCLRCDTQAALTQPEPKECGTCGGSGIWSSNDEFDNGGDGHTNSYCPDCNGTGKAGE